MFLGLRELFYSKLRYFLVTGIMILIVLLSLFLSGLANGLAYDNASSVANNDVPYYVLAKDAQGKVERSLFPESDLAGIKDVKNVKDAAVLGQSMQTLKRADDGKKFSMAVFAITPGSFLEPKVTSGSQMSVTKPDGVILDSSLEGDLKIGDVLEDDILNKQMTVIGFAKDQKYSHAPIVYMNMAIWQAINPSLYHQKIPQTSTIAVLADNPDKSISIDNKELTTITHKDFLGQIPGYSAEQMTLNMMIFFLIVIGGFILTAFFYIMTLQKTGQFGILKALGTKISYLVASVVSQVLLISVVSIGISIAATAGLSMIMPDAMPFRLTGLTMALYSGLFFAVAVIGSLLSLIKIAKVDALDAIRGGDQ
ncbi:ABC transporter permease [Listeria rocourtiae]|uniref:ABC transporter permease n=1 Tax=Listeria rocourtiae TaxID=647910 RepID=UPI00162A15C9|nr:ABC transporter permease [Listeria rocourtiae]MBC1605601.1 ABC transporter permease [Listeria rocourtiae]